MNLSIENRIFLAVILGPEKVGAFKKYQDTLRCQERYSKDPEYRKKVNARNRKFSASDSHKGHRRGRYREDVFHRSRILFQCKQWQDSNPATPEQILRRREYGRKYRELNGEKISKRVSEWGRVNRSRRTAVMREYRKNPDVRLKMGMRRRVWKALKGVNKSARTFEIIGCDLKELKSHLEQRFRSGMTWKNYGSVWHVDHIRPCASFDLSKPEEQKVCFHYSNLQPLFAQENLSKGSKWKEK